MKNYALTDFTTDMDKMVDFFMISKDEFLNSYSYLDEEEYDLTLAKVRTTENRELLRLFGLVIEQMKQNLKDDILLDIDDCADWCDEWEEPVLSLKHANMVINEYL